MQVSGEIQNIIFNNAETGYTVIDVKLDSGEFITAVGIFPPVTESEQVVMRGSFKFHSRHGRQFAADEIEIYPPKQAESIVKYLSSGLFKGVGEATARAIVTKFGNQTLEIIEKSPTQLFKVKGVSLKKAMEIGLAFNSMRRMQDAILFLQKFSISINMAIKIYRIYGDDTKKTVEANPYRLIDDVDRLGFATADRMAAEMGIEKDSDFRIKAGITYTLKDFAAKNGHTFLPRTLLTDEVLKLLGFDESMTDRIAYNIEDMVFLKQLYLYDLDDDKAVMTYPAYLLERSLARRLAAIEEEHAAVITARDGYIEKYEAKNGITLHQSQKEAVTAAFERGVEIITGGPGTGKTTIIKCIAEIFEQQGRKAVLCAPTGRAAKRLSEATGREAKTIHRLLDLDFKDGKGYFTYNENTRLPADVVIVDEVSMVDEYVFGALVKAVDRGAGLILVGDKDQLPSVGAGNVLADLIASGKFAVTCLTHIYRQAEQSLIVTNAHRINNGRMPVLDVKDNDFFFEEKDSPAEARNAVVELVTKRIPDYFKVNADDIQVLCPMKKGIAGVESLNAEIRQKLNPPKYKSPEMKSGETSYRVGDKVMQIVNDYQQEWTLKTEEGVESGSGIFNGELGYIEEINMLNQKFKVRFTDDKVAIYSFSDLEHLVLAYAVSIHKSQGSEFDTVVISVTGNNFMLMTRNLLYTAVTRAKKRVVLVGSREAVAKMVKNNYTAKRFTLLKEFLDEERSL
ncbi:MAG TPA: ATP-dependent RecD-like DNA helicase [Candidatus Faecicola pullistercoris]|nr:ATP-dependent RecD-like DNA helicase [Candidatus Faecicola pullistercoris]